MKQKVLVVLVVIILFGFFYYKELTKISLNENNLKIENSSGLLSIMLQTDDGEYIESTSGTWPGEDYTFNDILSKCENGGTLSYNDGKVTLKTSNSDKCYLYFDMYHLPSITSVDIEKSTDSVTVTIKANKGTSDISKYLFSIDGGTNYIESTTNTYTFSSLTAGTTYTLKTKIIDTLNKESSIYTSKATPGNVITFCLDLLSDGECMDEPYSNLEAVENMTVSEWCESEFNDVGAECYGDMAHLTFSEIYCVIYEGTITSGAKMTGSCVA